MKRFLEHNVPPGYRYQTECAVVSMVLATCVLISLAGFLSAFEKERRALYVWAWQSEEWVLGEGKMMPDFAAILGNQLLVLIVVAALVFAAASLMHYAYYHSGSKSIYLMRRLPNRFELHRRCLLMSLLSALVFVLVALVLLVIYFAIYMTVTPEVCLMPDQWQKIWSVF
ncbi:MAG: hypothetical protein LIO58_07365 [Oscillospiraceae bacterium]|nr:hypothetical protein [Oscillospiraceae bacterium]